jgi:hemerythrin
MARHLVAPSRRLAPVGLLARFLLSSQIVNGGPRMLRSPTQSEIDDGIIRLIESRVLGIRAIDQQHAYFLDLYNELVTQINSADRPKIILSPFIAEVFSYTDYHFRTEESLMLTLKYPDLETHRADHRSFFHKFDELTGRLAEQQADISELTGLIRGWITNHIETHDRQFAHYYSALKAGRR